MASPVSSRASSPLSPPLPLSTPWHSPSFSSSLSTSSLSSSSPRALSPPPPSIASGPEDEAPLAPRGPSSSAAARAVFGAPYASSTQWAQKPNRAKYSFEQRVFLINNRKKSGKELLAILRAGVPGMLEPDTDVAKTATGVIALITHLLSKINSSLSLESTLGPSRLDGVDSSVLEVDDDDDDYDYDYDDDDADADDESAGRRLGHVYDEPEVFTT
ncbi:hypothetical protein H072_11434 [Dactylellina haptotyla CBS 200.50]|uniref:Uncharacterized protein n=1 Tax=Dactylellina haptotyla (strain CBS 200.50) TaxID=1284197 RepID=S8B7W5_DACHA|nr:hypothetical protein H072_11434 [Dactylellina haptotyla CBS 200.50]